MRVHPFAVSSDDLRVVLAPALRQQDAEAGSIRLRLPCIDDEPVASAHLQGVVASEEIEPSALGAIDVPTLSIAPAAALHLLRRLEESPPLQLECEQSVRFFAALARFVEHFLIDQRYVPSILQYQHGVVEGVWAPWIDDPAELERLEGLIRSMPPAARAAVDDFEHQAALIVEDAFRRITDATVRDVLIHHDFAEAIDGRDPSADAHVPLIAMLTDHRAQQRLGGSSAAELFRDVRSWISRLSRADESVPYQLRLVLEEPHAPPREGVHVLEDATWRLRIELSPRSSGPEVPVAISELWSAMPAAAFRIDPAAAQEFVMQELARLRGIYPALAEALETDPPSDLELTTRQAHQFLIEFEPLLAEAGVDVRLPSWWGSGAARLGATLSIFPIEDAPHGSGDGSTARGDAGRMGLQTLARYEWSVTVGERQLSFEEFKQLARSALPLVQLDGRWLELRPDDVAAAKSLFEEGAAGEMTVFQALQRAYGVAGHPSAAPALRVVGLHARGWIEELLEASSDGAALEMIPQPESLRGALRPYQLRGLSWLVYLDTFGLGACLADDMGLGKTVQLIVLLLHERVASSNGRSRKPTLVVAPMSVISNWHREIERFAPSLSVLVYHGPDRPSGDALVSAASRCDVVLTTYALASRDAETLRRVRWGRVVLDEAQYVKNTPTKQAQAIRSFSTDRRVALTGTPIENRLSELWSIMDFLNPGYLGTAAEFRRNFAIPIERHRDPERGAALRQLIRPFVLRRLKTDPLVVPDLPDLLKTKQYATLTSEQARLYQRVVDTMLQDADQADGMQRRGVVLAGIVKLKQICNHPANLVDQAAAKTIDASPAEANGDARGTLSRRSGKMHTLLPLLDELIAAGDQALIFTQYRRMGHLLERMIQHDLDAPVLFLHGGTPRAKRQEMIDRFQDPSVHTPVFVLSLRAGGVGLNLTAANHVIHYDRWWNPAVESQATDRAFRIGQTRNVHVHTLICSGTLEEHIDAMLEQKSDLAERIVGAGDAWLTELSTAQLRDLLTLRQSAFAEIDSAGDQAEDDPDE